MSKLSQHILEKIKNEDLKPTSKWVFRAKNGLFWGIFAGAAITGSRAIAVLIRIVSDSEFLLATSAQGGFIPPLRHLLHPFWLLFFLLFLLFASYGLHQTKNGYRFQTWKLIILNLFISLVIGVGGFLVGDGERFEKYIHDRAPFFKMHEENQRLLWSAPDQGRLGGEIIEIQDEKLLILNAFDESIWTVDYQNSEQRKKFTPEVGYLVRIVGKSSGENTFIAEIMKPWKKLAPDKRRPRKIQNNQNR